MMHSVRQKFPAEYPSVHPVVPVSPLAEYRIFIMFPPNTFLLLPNKQKPPSGQNALYGQTLSIPQNPLLSHLDVPPSTSYANEYPALPYGIVQSTGKYPLSSHDAHRCSILSLICCKAISMYLHTLSCSRITRNNSFGKCAGYA